MKFKVFLLLLLLYLLAIANLSSLVAINTTTDIFPNSDNKKQITTENIMTIEDVLKIISYPDVSKLSLHDTTIAIIDSGFNNSIITNHWINNNEIPNNNLDDDKNGYIDDIFGWDFVENKSISQSDHFSDHGTFIGNIIKNIVPNANIMNIRVLNEKNSNNQFSDFAYAILYAISFPEVKTIQFSIDFRPNLFINYPDILKWAFTSAYLNNVTIISVSGNEGDSKLSEPGIWAETISVTSIDKLENLSWTNAYYSNTGDNIDVSVPGSKIESLGFDSSKIILTGTSFSAAFVGGAVTLLQSISHNALSPRDVRVLIHESSQDLGDCSKYGSGLLNITNLLSTYKYSKLKSLTLKCQPSYSIPTTLPTLLKSELNLSFQFSDFVFSISILIIVIKFKKITKY